MTAHREFSNLVQIEKKTKALYALITQIEIEFHIFPTLFSQAEKNIKMSSMKITICFYRSTKLCALGKENYRRKIWCYRMGSTVRLVPSPIINTIEWSGFCADLLCVEIFKNKILVSARKKSNFSSTFLKSTALVCLGFLLLKLFFYHDTIWKALSHLKFMCLSHEIWLLSSVWTLLTLQNGQI